MDCEGSCGRSITPDDVKGFYAVLMPHGEKLNFCSPACIESWLAMESNERLRRSVEQAESGKLRPRPDKSRKSQS